MSRPCESVHNFPGEDCRVCWLISQPGPLGEKYRQVWGVDSSSIGIVEDGPCIYLGKATGELVSCPSCRGNVQLKLFECGVHKVCTPQKKATNIVCCVNCSDYQSKGTVVTNDVQLIVSANGIGDHLLALAAATSWKQDNPTRKLTLVAKTWQTQWLDLFEGYDKLTSDPSPNLTQVYNISSRGDFHYIEVIQRFNLVPPKLRPLSNNSIDWAKQYTGYVVLCPGAGYHKPNSPKWAVNNRVWLPSHWLLLERLLIDSGRKVIAIDTNAERVSFFKEALVGLPPNRVAALMKAALLVVSNESGMAHLAGALEVPCITLSGPLNGKEIHHIWKNTKVIQGPLSCSGCRWKGPNYKPHCDILCASLQSIQPSDVMKEVDTLDTTTPRLQRLLDRVDSANWNGRQRIFRYALTLLEGKLNPLIVETGCQRQEDDVGAGMSTLIFGLYVKTHNGNVISLDNDPYHTEIAFKVTKDLPVEVRCANSLTHLYRWHDKQIDLLYLDSLDTYEPGFAEHCLEETKAALSLLKKESVILIDDTFIEFGQWTGKGKLAVPYLLSQGWQVVISNHQTLLMQM